MHPLKEIMNYFSESEVYYINLFMTSLPPNVRDTNRATLPLSNGIVIAIKGSALFGLDGQFFELKKGRVLYAGPSMDLDIITTNEAVEYVVIHYKTLNEVSNSLLPFSTDVGESSELDYLVQQILTADEIPGPLMKVKCRSLFLQIIEILLVNAKLQTINNHVEQAIQYMRNNYHLPITINNVSESVQCKRRKLAYLFDKQIGMSPIQFLTELRLKHAQKLLRTTTIPVKTIAELVGYQDSFYFCRVFKKQYDLTPTTYRQKLWV